MRTLPCCHRVREMSFDFDESDPRVRTYSGLESCALNHGFPCEVEYSADELSRSSSSCKEEGSFASSSPGAGTGAENDEECSLLAGDWAVVKSPYPFYSGQRAPLPEEQKVPLYSMGFADVEVMKEKFAQLLLGEDGSGGRRGIATAVALSNAITTLAAATFGELWKLKPLPEEKKSRWRREMEWLLSPTNYMVELVPALQPAAGGRPLEIMTPRLRADVHTALPALQKLDSILLEVLDSMADTEFWYAEGGSRAAAHGGAARPGKRWWLPAPRVPEAGLSSPQRKKLGFQAKCVFQVLKAVKSINEQTLLLMPLPPAVKRALPKSGKVGLRDELNRLLISGLCSVEDVLPSLDLSSEHAVLDMVNRLEGVAFACREKLSSGRSPAALRLPWSADGGSKAAAKLGVFLERAEALLRLLRDQFPNLPLSFIAVEKIRSTKDVGHAIVEAYSRALGNLAFSILARIGDVLQEDDLHRPSTPIAAAAAAAALKLDLSPGYIKRSLIDQMNQADGRCRLVQRKPATTTV